MPPRPFDGAPPTVSIITPAYNAAKYLSETISSALLQTYQHFELLVVDDGSSDATLKIAGAFERADRRVRVFTRRNGGISAARNVAMRVARGSVFALLDSDDLWDPLYLERQVALLDRFTVDVVTDNARNLGGPDDGRPLHGDLSEYRVISLVDLIEREDAVCITAVFRREVYERVGGFDERLRRNEDYHYWIRAAHAGFRFLENPTPLASYRRRPESVSANEALMTTGIIRVLEQARAICHDRPQELAAIDRRVAHFERERVRLSAKSHLLRGEYRAAAEEFETLSRISGTLRSRLIARASRYSPQSLVGAYRLKTACRPWIRRATRRATG